MSDPQPNVVVGTVLEVIGPESRDSGPITYSRHMVELQILGGGKMGEALLGGLLAAGWCTPGAVRVVEASQLRRDELTAQFPGVEITALPGAATSTILAVKPGEIVAVAAATNKAGGGRLLSIAAGVRIAELEAVLSPGTVVIRAMPNTPALVGQGVSAIAPGAAATEEDLAWAAEVLGAVGVVERVSEAQLDAVTAVSGSGPAYVFLIAEAMIEAGVLAGLPRPLSETLAIQTLVGASALLAVGEHSPAELRAMVTSPGGTTAAGVRELERGGVRSAILDAVMAARDRSEELGA